MKRLVMTVLAMTLLVFGFGSPTISANGTPDNLVTGEAPGSLHFGPGGVTFNDNLNDGVPPPELTLGAPGPGPSHPGQP